MSELLDNENIKVINITVEYNGDKTYFLYNRKPIPVAVEDIINDEFIINWRADLVPQDPMERTYAERYGESIKGVKGNQLISDVEGVKEYEPYEPGYTFTMVDDEITSLKITPVSIGTLSIL